jgi:hypothetical protein
MSTSDYILFIGLFVGVLATQLGRREPSAKRLIMPLILTAAVGWSYIEHPPAGSTSHLLEIGGLVVGAAFGIASVLLVKVEKNPETGKLVTITGWPYVAVLGVAFGARLAFAYGSTHWFEGSITSFSVAHHVPAAAYGSALTLMVLAMIAVRTVVVVARAYQVGAPVDFSELRPGGGAGGQRGGLLSKVRGDVHRMQNVVR